MELCQFSSGSSRQIAACIVGSSIQLHTINSSCHDLRTILWYYIIILSIWGPDLNANRNYFFDRSGTTRPEYTIILSSRVPADASNVTLFPYVFHVRQWYCCPVGLDREIWNIVIEKYVLRAIFASIDFRYYLSSSLNVNHSIYKYDNTSSYIFYLQRLLDVMSCRFSLNQRLIGQLELHIDRDFIFVLPIVS